MGYAVRNDGTYGVRAVDGPDACAGNEIFTENFVDYVATDGDRFRSLRKARDSRLASTDKMMLPDYPVSANDLNSIKTYREALRNLPDATGAPWDGGGEATPWPVMPKI